MSASKRWPFSLLNDEQMSNWVGVKHLPVEITTWVVQFFYAKNVWSSGPVGGCFVTLVYPGNVRSTIDATLFVVFSWSPKSLQNHLAEGIADCMK